MVPADHWSRAVTRRLVLLDTGSLIRIARGWPRPRAELPTTGDSAATSTAELQAGFLSRAGAMQAGTSLRTADGFFYPGPRPLADRNTPFLAANLAAQMTPALAAGVETSATDAGLTVRAAYLNWAWGPVDGWIGRRPIGLGTGPRDGIVLNERTSFNGTGVALREGVKIPVLGRLYADISAARLRRSGTVRHPWFHATRLTISPQNSLAIGLNRAAIFGGDDENEITPARIALMLLGFPDVSGKDSDFENQVASIELLWRTAVRGWPLALHTEYGADDSGFAFLHVPAMIAGVELVAVPGAPHLGVGVEAVYFSRRCCTYPPWYRHGALADGWTDRGGLLGHPLGGDGTELAMTVEWIPTRQNGVASLRLYERHRGVDNLFAPNRAGNSVGGELSVVMPWRRFRFEVRADGERWEGERAGGLRVFGSRSF
ncbi:MAG: capsule assembly Wzi family protein [Gemmatimonadota bacterium]